MTDDQQALRQALLRERFEVGSATKGAFTAILVTAIAVTFWRVSPHVPLLIWSALKAATAIAVFASRRRDLDFRRWYRSEMVLGLAEGFMWGLLPVVAMPNDAVYQAIMAGVLACVVIASSMGESQFRALHLNFVVAMAATVTFGFFVAPGGLTIAGILFLVACPFALVSSNDERLLHNRLADMTIENRSLVAKLEQDHSELAALNAKLDALAWTDSLTGLANRAAATRRMHEALSATGTNSQPLTVVYLDLDRFKQVNDQFGHGTGDEILICVAKRLNEQATDAELVCRLGGDELIVLSHTADVIALADRIAAAFDRPLSVRGREFNVTASMGVATMAPPGSPDDLLQRADQALYHHKRSVRTDGGKRWSRWDGVSDVEQDACDQVHAEGHENGQVEQTGRRHNR